MSPIIHRENRAQGIATSLPSTQTVANLP
jgi:hypothetical protein